MIDTHRRWRLERAGIINLFEYADEEFVFDEGRLILKGPNGSGKSKALELLFPFLFEGDMAPTKLDPFGKRSRTMKWNLLMDNKHDSRVGYVWATVVHDDPEHDPQCVTFVSGYVLRGQAAGARSRSASRVGVNSMRVGGVVSRCLWMRVTKAWAMAGSNWVPASLVISRSACSVDWAKR